MVSLRIFFVCVCVYYPMIDSLKTTFSVFGLRGKSQQLSSFVASPSVYTELDCKAPSGLLKIIIE